MSHKVSKVARVLPNGADRFWGKWEENEETQKNKYTVKENHGKVQTEEATGSQA